MGKISTFDLHKIKCRHECTNGNEEKIATNARMEIKKK